MKRFHVHVAVNDLKDSIQFYSGLFGAKPDVEKPDYAKWMLDDPRVNFAISKRGHAAGVNHLGFQVDSDEELTGLRQRIDNSGLDALEQQGTNCCYAKSDKHWLVDPQGIAWENFHTLESVPVFGDENAPAETSNAACCVPIEAENTSAQKSGCCG